MFVAALSCCHSLGHTISACSIAIPPLWARAQSCVAQVIYLLVQRLSDTPSKAREEPSWPQTLSPHIYTLIYRETAELIPLKLFSGVQRQSRCRVSFRILRSLGLWGIITYLGTLSRISGEPGHQPLQTDIREPNRGYTQSEVVYTCVHCCVQVGILMCTHVYTFPSQVVGILLVSLHLGDRYFCLGCILLDYFALDLW